MRKRKGDFLIITIYILIIDPKGQHALDWNLVLEKCALYGSLYCEHQNLQTNLVEERAPHYECPSHATFQLLFKTKKRNLCPKLSTSYLTQPKEDLLKLLGVIGEHLTQHI